MHHEISPNVYSGAYMMDISMQVIFLRGCAALRVIGFTSVVYFSDVRTWDHPMSVISAQKLF